MRERFTNWLMLVLMVEGVVLLSIVIGVAIFRMLIER